MPVQLTPASAIDLQMHTTLSDGDWAPEQLLDHLAQEGFALVAITDHDRIDTTAYLQELGASKGVEILPATELSTNWRGLTTDVLCFGFGADHSELQVFCDDVLRRRKENAIEVCERLTHQGYAFPRKQEVLQASGGQPFNHVGLLALLREHGYGETIENRWQIIYNAGFDFPTNDIAPVVEAAHRCGAVCLIAHPGRAEITCFELEMLDQLRQEAPIDGLEVYYPIHTPEQTAMYAAYAQQHGLLVSSGSDSHRPSKLPIKYRAEQSRELLERLGVQIS